MSRRLHPELSCRAKKLEEILAEKQEDSGAVKRLEAFMMKYGYQDGYRWWVKNDFAIVLNCGIPRRNGLKRNM